MQLKNIPARAASFVFAALLLAVFCVAPARAQEEAPPVVLDEPVVQVDNDVIMLSQLKRENNEFRDVLIKQRGLTPEQAAVEIEKKQPEIIFNLINEALLVQKGKDIPRLSEDVEAEVNREVLRVAKQSNIQTIEQLEEAMKQEGLSLSDIKETLRRQFMRQAVLQREVDAKIYYGLTDTELRKYYDANRAKFASVTVSEIFLSLAGRSEEEVKAKAADLAARARTGTDFAELVEKNSEHEQTKKTKGVLVDSDGKPRWFLVSDLSPAIAGVVQNLKAGGISDPIKADEGYMIIRVNERDDSFKENFVRGVITTERSDAAHEDYLKTLRKEAYIKPADNYKAVVQPLIDKDKQQTASTPQAAPAPEKKEKNKKQ
ncbi:MAG: peptidyl-prolyl cis-trans isomerase SurA [Acidobacteriota bacterium]|nr:peptidyl-prolyl cis-trans isomerase SurA [Acidobacteriota bacterium]